MLLYSDIYNRFLEKGFYKSKPIELENRPVDYLTNGKINVILKTYDLSSLKAEILISDSITFKNELLPQGINVWNTYFIIIIDGEVSHDLILNTEKDFRGIRKYIVNEKEDFERISILHDFKESDIEANERNYFKTKDSTLKVIIDIFEQENLIESKLSKQSEEDVTTKIINRVVYENEN